MAADRKARNLPTGAAENGRYDRLTMDRGLAQVALCNGNAEMASRRLAEEGVTIPARTLRDWREREPDRYRQVRDRVLPEVFDQVRDDCLDLAGREAAVSAQLVDRLGGAVPDGKASDLAQLGSALRNLETAKAINVDKASVLDGRPTEIAAPRQLADIIAAMQAKGFIESVEWGGPPRLEITSSSESQNE